MPDPAVATCYFLFSFSSVLSNFLVCLTFVLSNFLELALCFLLCVCYVFVTKMANIYHGCFRKNADGTNRIIANNENCLISTSRAFWKYIEDISAGVKTRSQYKRQKLVDRITFDIYFRNKNKEDIEKWLTAPYSEVRILKGSNYIYNI